MRFSIELNQRSFGLHYDKDYGIDKRSGWSVVVNGVVCVQFEKRLVKALVKTVDVVKDWERPESAMVNTMVKLTRAPSWLSEKDRGRFYERKR